MIFELQLRFAGIEPPLQLRDNVVGCRLRISNRLGFVVVGLCASDARRKQPGEHGNTDGTHERAVSG